MIRTDDSQSLTEFQKNATTHLDRLAENGLAEVLTVDGEAKGVVMSPQAFEELAEKAEILDSLAMIDKSMEDIKAGRTHDAKEAVREIAKELGLNLNQ